MDSWADMANRTVAVDKSERLPAAHNAASTSPLLPALLPWSPLPPPPPPPLPQLPREQAEQPEVQPTAPRKPTGHRTPAAPVQATTF